MSILLNKKVKQKTIEIKQPEPEEPKKPKEPKIDYSNKIKALETQIELLKDQLKAQETNGTFYQEIQVYRIVINRLINHYIRTWFKDKKPEKQGKMLEEWEEIEKLKELLNK